MIGFLALLAALLCALQFKIRDSNNKTAANADQVARALASKLRAKATSGGTALSGVQMLSPLSPLFDQGNAGYEQAQSPPAKEDSFKIKPYARSEDAQSRVAQRTATYADADETDYDMATRTGTYGEINQGLTMQTEVGTAVHTKLNAAISSASTQLEKQVLDFVMNAGVDHQDSIYDNRVQASTQAFEEPKYGLAHPTDPADGDVTYEVASDRHCTDPRSNPVSQGHVMSFNEDLYDVASAKNVNEPDDTYELATHRPWQPVGGDQVYEMAANRATDTDSDIDGDCHDEVDDDDLYDVTTTTTRSSSVRSARPRVLSPNAMHDFGARVRSP